ncbi:MAG: RNA ligase family protein [Pseudomonas sp.]|nr:RNA ligase family protein [Pseudomonas sp.]MDZ4349033.1 RNA ligase family protein [Xanthomonadaceae bacterium]
MSEPFFRFPHTPHLAWLGTGEPRDDKLLSPGEAKELLAGEVVIEEKLDGANLGISLGDDGELRAQNRGQYLQPPYTGQFSRLVGWLQAHKAALRDVLTPGRIVFGEWCAARHSLDYTALPDWWLIFDIYERATERFWCTERRNAWATAIGVPTVPELGRGGYTQEQLKHLLDACPSRYRDGPMEGIVVRKQDAQHMIARAKLVRPDFSQAIDQHWRRRGVQWNHCAPSATYRR